MGGRRRRLQIQTLVHNTSNGRESLLVQENADSYVLAYTGPDSDGFITPFTISDEGSTLTEVATLEYDTLKGTANSLVQVDAGFPCRADSAG